MCLVAFRLKKEKGGFGVFICANRDEFFRKTHKRACIIGTQGFLRVRIYLPEAPGWV